MEYPVWTVLSLSSALPVAIIAIVHVLVAHFAVGGGLFLALTEHKAYRENNPAILDYVHKHTLFFLLLTMVFGGLTGVGIWFIITLASPQGTSLLIHTFVFGWATEWVFFLGEIVALLVYYYKFRQLDRRTHLTLGWLYFIFAWLSLFMITGIVDFMLTPGAWPETGNFWDGFFNESFWPSLFFRSAMSFTFAGVFAFVTAPRIKDKATREGMMRYATLWVAAPLALLLASGWWYLKALPLAQQQMILAMSPETMRMIEAFLWLTAVLLVGGLLITFIFPNKARWPVTALLITASLLHIGAFEWTREAGRRPWLVHNVLYSNNVFADQAAAIDAEGFLAKAKWIDAREITDENRLDVGRQIFAHQCLACHSVGGPMLDILPRTQKHPVFGLDSQLNGQGKLQTYMPPFFGTPDERWALASYIVEDLHGKKTAEPAPYQAPQLEVEVPPFDRDTAEYVLLAWNNLGMHCISDSDKWWILLPPANDLYAQLIRRGDIPELVTEGVRIEYDVEDGFENPSAHVDFWKYADKLFGKKLPDNIGVGGKGVKGEMEAKPDLRAFSADLVPVVPYPDAGKAGAPFNPYPIFTVTAFDEATGKKLAETRCVAPTSTEMGCRNCHGGEWRVGGVAGFTDATSRDVLAVHDKNNGTNLVERAERGEPMLCQSCHADPVLGAKGNPDLLNFPAALHGWHANYLTERGTEACFRCHPASAAGPTGCLRGVHADRGLDCVSCHGTLEDHALGLLKGELDKGKKTAARLMKNLKPRTVDSVDVINGRTPWLMEPDCASCHDFSEKPDPTGTAYNKWTSGTPTDLYRLRHDDMGAIMCEACHGSTHAVYPAANIYGEDRDNIPPLQYQGEAGPVGMGMNCASCHLNDMDFFAHHPIPGQ